MDQSPEDLARVKRRHVVLDIPIARNEAGVAIGRLAAPLERTDPVVMAGGRRTSVFGTELEHLVIWTDVGAAAGQVFIGNPEIADVRMQPSQGDGHFQITMKKSGRQETLIFWGAN